ncbi:MAG: hypothetical protein AAGH92_04960 [Planctomycetota bacterium]
MKLFGAGSRLVGLLCSGAIVFVSLGCETPQLNRDDMVPEPVVVASAEMPSYREMVSRYNDRLIGIDLVSARTDVEVVWRDERGKVRRESGDGRLIVRRPLDTAVTVEAFGQMVMWAGSNDRQYWFFTDLHRGGEAVHGRFGGAGIASLPMPVSPELIPVLLGLTPLPEDVPGANEPVEAMWGYALVEPPGLGVRMLLDLETAAPVRVDLLDATGASAVVCRLEGRQDIERPERDDLIVEGGMLVVPNMDPDGAVGKLMPAAAAPDTPLAMPDTVTMYPVHDESRLTLELKRVRLEDSSVKGRLFDLDTLIKHLKPDRVIDLDAP